MPAVEPFNIQQLADKPFHAVIIGNPHSVKGVLIRDILLHTRVCPAAVSTCVERIEEYKDLIPEELVYIEHVEDPLVRRILDGNASLVVFDSCIWDNYVISTDTFNDLFNIDKSSIMVFGLPLKPHIEKLDYVFLTWTPVSVIRKILFRYYGHYMFADVETFSNVFDSLNSREEEFDINIIFVLDMKQKTYYQYRAGPIEAKEESTEVDPIIKRPSLLPHPQKNT